MALEHSGQMQHRKRGNEFWDHSGNKTTPSSMLQGDFSWWPGVEFCPLPMKSFFPMELNMKPRPFMGSWPHPMKKAPSNALSIRVMSTHYASNAD